MTFGRSEAPRTALLTTYTLRQSSRPRTMALGDFKERRLLVHLVLVFALFAGAVAAADVWIRLRVLELGYRLEATHRAIERLELQRRELQLRAARAEDAEHLQQLAKVRLGLGPASASQRVVVP